MSDSANVWIIVPPTLEREVTAALHGAGGVVVSLEKHNEIESEVGAVVPADFVPSFEAWLQNLRTRESSANSGRVWRRFVSCTVLLAVLVYSLLDWVYGNRRDNVAVGMFYFQLPWANPELRRLLLMIGSIVAGGVAVHFVKAPCETLWIKRSVSFLGAGLMWACGAYTVLLCYPGLQTGFTNSGVSTLAVVAILPCVVTDFTLRLWLSAKWPKQSSDGGVV